MKKTALLLCLLCLSCFPVSAQFWGPGSAPLWYKYSLVAIANGVNGCVNANGCWQVNGALGANKAAGLTQNIVLFQLPANGFIRRVSVKTTVVFGGTATANCSIGTATTNTFYLLGPYNLQTAVAATNFIDANSISGRDTTAALNVVLGLTTTVNNIELITTGSAVDVWASWSVLP